MHITNNNKNAHWFLKLVNFAVLLICKSDYLSICKSDNLLFRLMTVNQQNNILKVSLKSESFIHNQ